MCKYTASYSTCVYVVYACECLCVCVCACVVEPAPHRQLRGSNMARVRHEACCHP